MKTILVLSALFLLITGTALAGSGYDNCIKEEKALKAEEVSACGGLSYLLNPSSCFAKRKLLKEYSAGKCRKIGAAENVDFSAVTVIPEKKDIIIGTGSRVSTPASATAIKAAPGAVQGETTLEQLKEENTRLKAEVIRLTTELEQYTKACR